MTALASSGTSVLLEALGRELPADRLVVDPDVLAGLSHDEAEWAAVGQAALALRARSEAEVQIAVRICADLGVPVVARQGVVRSAAFPAT